MHKGTEHNHIKSIGAIVPRRWLHRDTFEFFNPFIGNTEDVSEGENVIEKLGVFFYHGLNTVFFDGFKEIFEATEFT